MWFAVCMTWGLLSNAMGIAWDTWQFWANFGLLWCAQQSGQIQGESNSINALVQELENLKNKKD